MSEKNTLAHKMCASDAWISNIVVRSYFFLKKYVTSEGAFSLNVLFSQQLSIVCFKVSFYADNYFEDDIVYGLVNGGE